jgi:hypothetical protein
VHSHSEGGWPPRLATRGACEQIAVITDAADSAAAAHAADAPPPGPVLAFGAETGAGKSPLTRARPRHLSGLCTRNRPAFTGEFLLWVVTVLGRGR